MTPRFALKNITLGFGLGFGLAALWAVPSFASPLSEATARAVKDHALPAVIRFEDAAQDFDKASQSDCTPLSLQPAYHAAFDAWMGLQHLNIGPIEENARLLTVAYWPDRKGSTPRSLSRLIAAQDAALLQPDAFSEVSIAARGLFALEFMLFDAAYNSYGAEGYACELVQAIGHDLARTASQISEGWQGEGGFAEVLNSAGAADNPRYYSEEEATQALYTMLTTGLENTAIARLGRPLGSFTKPRPRLAEAHRSDRSLRNIILSVEAARDLTFALAPETPVASLEAFDDVLALAEALDDPKLETVSDPSGRLKVEILQQRILALLGYIANDIGAPLEISAGFNASDGD